MADVPDRDCRGWMSWEVFRCRTDCTGSNEGFCVDETTYKAQADALVSGGFRAAGCARSLASHPAAATTRPRTLPALSFYASGAHALSPRTALCVQQLTATDRRPLRACDCREQTRR